MLLRPALLFGLTAILAGCQSAPSGTQSNYPTTHSLARTTPSLEELPPPRRPVQLAVYAFPDLTGARKPNPNYPDDSFAVTQGASAVLVHALKKAGRGQWFRVVERDGLQNLLRERELIQATKAVLKGSVPAVAPLRFADYILEGGIVSFDHEFEAGGIGASYLGVKGDANYRKDMVTVALRLTAVQTGEILLSVTSARTLFSTSVAAGLSRYVSSDLLNASTGMTRVDPTQLAVQEAIEAAVLQLIQDGADAGLWSFQAPAVAAAIVAEPPITGSIQVPAALTPPPTEPGRTRVELPVPDADAPAPAVAAEHDDEKPQAGRIKTRAKVAATAPGEAGYWIDQLRRR